MDVFANNFETLILAFQNHSDAVVRKKILYRFKIKILWPVLLGGLIEK